MFTFLLVSWCPWAVTNKSMYDAAAAVLQAIRICAGVFVGQVTAFARRHRCGNTRWFCNHFSRQRYATMQIHCRSYGLESTPSIRNTVIPTIKNRQKNASLHIWFMVVSGRGGCRGCVSNAIDASGPSSWSDESLFDDGESSSKVDSEKKQQFLLKTIDTSIFSTGAEIKCTNHSNESGKNKIC